MKVSKWMATSAVFAVLLVASLYGCYFFIRMPLTQSRNSRVLRYIQRAEYGYTALVKPSLLYDNRTEIGEGEPLYVNLVERLNIDFSYDLDEEPKTVEMANASLECEVTAFLSGGDWSKAYPLGSRVTNETGFTETYTLNITEIEEIIETIGEETGTRAHSYTYEIRHRIRLEASAGNESIEQEFTPTLTIKFEGGKIDFEGLKDTKVDSITHYSTEVATYMFLGSLMNVSDMRGIVVIVALALSVILFYSGRLFLRERASRTFMERLSEDIRDRIVETSEPPERIEKTTIKVGSLEDLAKVAEETFKPIMHHGEVFYVLDGDVRYEFSMVVIANVEEK